MSENQIDFLIEEMVKLSVKDWQIFASVQGRRYGYISFDTPKSGYLSCICDSGYKRLTKIAKESNTRMYITNGLIDDIKQGFKSRIMFTAQ